MAASRLPSFLRFFERRGGAVRVRAHLWGLVRVAAYLSLMGLVSTYFVLRSARADAARALYAMGGRLLSEFEPLLYAQAEAFSVNGQALRLASHQTDLTVSEVLDRLSGRCHGEQAELPFEHEGGAMSPGERSLSDTLAQLLALRVVRHQEGDAGQLACFVPPPWGGGLKALVDAVRELADTGDLARLGQFHYAIARRTENGKTHLLLAWAEGPLRIGELFPAEGDAPGDDIEGVPRPPASVRELSARSARGNAALNLYTSRESPARVLAFYERALAEAGFLPLVDPQKLKRGDADYVHAFVRGGRAVALGVSPSAQTGTQVAIVDFGAVARAVSCGGSPCP